MRNKAGRETSRSFLLRLLNRRADGGASHCPVEAGFTLVEMLVVLVLSAVMAAMMVGGIRQMQIWAQLEKRQSAQSALEAVADHMSGELAGALSLPLLKRDGDEFTPMTGSSDSIRFVAVIRTGFSASALREASYSTQSSPTGATLMRKSQEHRLPPEGEKLQVQSEELYKGIGKLKFGYLTRDSENKMIWLDTWAKQVNLPIAVRIELADGFGLSVSRTVSLIN
ncbi:prepilin-type N-terminal cleavage/methylation domain-containing protein [Pararhizobium sp. LjRoot235]|uniref:prepilin-type N-terminal cleavage/methylation domain-containing protein n=1 Tax=Pararhizobium sp. LjRoot235 TaxID=3342291 RepID=UPI003ECE7AD9